VASFPLGRREFLAAISSCSLVASRGSAWERYPVHLRKPGPYTGALAHIESGTDDFRFEKEAQEIEGRLGAMMTSGSLPLAPDFKGSAPLPARYVPVAEGVGKAEYGSKEPFDSGLRKWIRSLGQVQRASFFVLPDQQVRFEIKSDGAYRVGSWKQIWTNGRLAEFAPIHETLVTRPNASEPLFRDVTAHAFGSVDSFEQQLLKGNPWWRCRLDSATGIDLYSGNGVSVGDIDNDGLDEIYVCQPGGLPNRLYKNRGDGTFFDITERAGVGVLDVTTSALFVDFRNSGNQDLVVLRNTGPLFFINKGDGTFTHVPDAFRFHTAPQGSFTGMAAADYDRDGRVDLYLCCYGHFQSEDRYQYPLPYHDARNGPPNFLFHNRLTASGGHFEDVTAESGISDNNNRYSFAAAWCDFDGDGWPDLYVANDFGTNNLYRNRAGKFRDEATEAGVADVGPGMSAAWFDYDGDGRPDLYVSNMWTAAGQRVVADPAFVPGRELKTAYHNHTKGNSLYRNRGDGTFEQTALAENVEMGRWAWGADAFDFDNDGSPEIFVTTGMLTNSSEKDLNSFFWRQVVAKSPTGEKPAPEYENGWNAINQLIREDYSWCGRESNVFYKRLAAPGEAPRFYDLSGVSGLDFADDSRAFAVTDIDGDGNPDVILKSRLAPQVRVLQNNCGTGKPALVIRLRGTKSNRDGIGARVEVNGCVQYAAAGSGYLSQHSKQLHFATPSNAHVRITWPSGLRQEFTNLAPGFRYEIQEGSDDVKSTALRAHSQLKSGGPLHAINRPEFGFTWLLEPVPLPDRRKGPGFLLVTDANTPALPPDVPVETIDVNRNSPDLAAQYSIFRRYLFDLRTDLELPLLLLIDGSGMAQKVYAGIPSPDILHADWKAFNQGMGSSLALPFPGTYYTRPQRSFYKHGIAFYQAGFPDQAIPYLEETIRRAPDNWKVHLALGRLHSEAERWNPALSSYQRVLVIRPGEPSALLGAGETYAKLGDFVSAEAMLRKALQSDPESSDAMNQLGLVLAEQGRTTEAKQLFERAIAINRDHGGAINNLAVLYMKLGQRNDAIAAFQYGIQVAPEDATLYLNLGRLYVGMGERDKARDLMRQLLEKKPGDPIATRALHDLETR
jgi:tetratricopeptide (TPR) repeat protein